VNILKLLISRSKEKNIVSKDGTKGVTYYTDNSNKRIPKKSKTIEIVYRETIEDRRSNRNIS